MASDRVNDYPVPLPDWWVAAVLREVAKRTKPDGEPWELKDLAEAADVKAYEISKCLHGKPMLEPVKKISDALLIPRPIAVFETEELAMVWERELRLRGLREQVAQIPRDPKGRRPR